MDSYDVVVVGGGAAGLSGAVALARSRRTVLVVDAGEPRNAPADGVHNLLGGRGRRRASCWRPDAPRWRVRRQVRERHRGRRPRRTATASWSSSATARRWRPGGCWSPPGWSTSCPTCPGVAELWGPTSCTARTATAGRRGTGAVGVLATSPLGMHGALLWRQLTDDVTVFLPTTPPASPDDDLERLAARDIAVVTGRVERLETTDGRLSGVRLADGSVVARDGPRRRAALHLAVGRAGGPRVWRRRSCAWVTRWSAPPSRPAPTGATSVPGVYVAGNVADLRAQVVSSAAAGPAWPARAINADLVEEDTARAVAAPDRAEVRVSTEVEQFWEQHYGAAERVWSGRAERHARRRRRGPGAGHARSTWAAARAATRSGWPCAAGR